MHLITSKPCPTTCPLFSSPSKFIHPEGTGSLGVLIIGEAGGKSEGRLGKPFVPYAAAGSLLERAFRLARFNRSQFRISNILSCAPPNDFLVGASYELDAINHCQMHRDRVVGEARPRAILALGATALRVLTGYTGRKQGISELRGYVLPSLDWGRIPVIASFHPAFIRRGKMNLLPVLLHDLKKAVAIAQGQVGEWTWDAEAEMVGYQTNPTLDEAEAFYRACEASPSQVIAYDIETPYSAQQDEEEADSALREEYDIKSIQFSTGRGTGIFLPWSGGYIDIARRVLALPNPKAGFNSYKFDDPRLERAGVCIAGRRTDCMLLWRHLQPDLPAGLQFVASFFGMTFPWKHLGDGNPAFYGIADVDATIRIYEQGLVQLEQRGLLDSFLRLRVGLEPVLKAMTGRGMPVDDARRLEFKEHIDTEQARLDWELQRIYPELIRPLHPKGGYKKTPKELVGAEPNVRVENLDTGVVYVPWKFDDGVRWCKLLPFLPNSTPQLVAYMKHKGHQVPLDLKKGTETTAAKELERLAKSTGDVFYAKVLEYRALDKMRSTYVDAWAPALDGCVHGQFYDNTGTGQLTSRDPNMLNAPKHGELAKQFRRMVYAKEGRRVVEIDLSAAHALTLGFEAGDPDYMRLARLDIHSYLTAHLLKDSERDNLLALGDAELGRRLADIKAHHKVVRDRKAKPTILGYGFGLGARKLYDMNRESFDNVKEAQGVIDMLNGLFPRTARFRQEIKEKAHRQQYLKSRWGWIRWFYAVFESDPKTGHLKSGEDSEAAIAYLPANDAFGHMRSVMLWLADEGLDEKYGLCNSVHDSLVFHCPAPLVEECVHLVHQRMTAPVPELDGLEFGAEASVGDDWSSLCPISST